MRAVGFCLLVLLQASMNSALTIEAPNGGTLGVWGAMEACPEGTKATGFRPKVQHKLGKWLYNFVTGLELLCTKPSSDVVEKRITSSVVDSGEWENDSVCGSSQYLTKFALSVADTAVTNVKVSCFDDEELGGGSLDMDDVWDFVCPLGINGIRIRANDIGITAVQMSCGN